MGIVTSQDPTPIECATPDGTNRITPLHSDTVREILARFRPLNPYDSAVIPDLWKQEHGSLDQPVWAHVLSAKRYALYRRLADSDADPPIELVHWTESGLGAYLDPLTKEQRDDGRDWIREAWEWILTDGHKNSLPDWADAYALTRFTLSSPAIQPWFHGYNQQHPRSHQIRPASFGLLAHPDPLLPNPGDVRPAAPYTSQPNEWDRLPWYDRATGQRLTVTTSSPSDADFMSDLDRGKIRIRTLGDVVAAFRRRPEHKSLAPDATPTTGDTHGLLRRRPIESAPVLTDLIGKEGNDLAERGVGLTDSPEGYRVNYGHRGDRWNTLVLPILRALGPREIMRRTGRGKSVVYEVLSGKPMRYRQPANRYSDIAISEARNRIKGSHGSVPRHDFGCLYRAAALDDYRDQA